MILIDSRVTDKVAIVTGAGGGIGAATRRVLAEAGADVVLAARSAAGPTSRSSPPRGRGPTVAGRWSCPPT